MLPRLVVARHDVSLLSTGSVSLVLVAFALEAASLVSYTGLTRAILPSDVGVGWPTQLAIDITGYGASHVLPGSGATAAGLRYRLMTAAGVDAHDAVTTAAVQTTLSDLALAGAYLLGVVTAVPEVRHRPVLLLTALAGLCVLVASGLAAGILPRRPVRRPGPLAGATTAWGRWVAQRWSRLRNDVVSFLRDSTRTRRAVGLAVANWLLDACCLWVCLWAFGGRMAPGLVLTAYGFANLLGLLPLTPGGLGVVEGTLIPLTIAFGAPASAAVLGVLTWRVLQFWLPVPAAGACYLGLRLSGRLDRGRDRHEEVRT